jgi:hypothetical protein
MMIMPVRASATEYDLNIILEDENIARMKEYDPAEIITGLMTDQFKQLKIRNVTILYANATDLAHVMILCDAGKPREALQYLARGFEFRPDRGDSNEPYPIVSAPAKTSLS